MQTPERVELELPGPEFEITINRSQVTLKRGRELVHTEPCFKGQFAALQKVNEIIRAIKTGTWQQGLNENPNPPSAA